MQKCMLVGVALSALLCGCMSESERLAYEQNLRAQREVEQKKYQEEVAKAKRTAAENQAKEESLNREKYWADLAMRNYDFLISGLTYARLKKTGGVPDRDAYIHNPSLRQAKGVKNQNMWQVARAIQSVDLSNWAGPRNGISEGLAQKGRSTMEAFASKYMPNAFANYEKYRDAVAEIQGLFNEEFLKTTKIEREEVLTTSTAKIRHGKNRKPAEDSVSKDEAPINMSPDNPKWAAFCKVLKGFSKARTRYFRSHDELCHYYILYKCGGISSDELAKIDSKPISVRLLEENVACLDFVPDELGSDEMPSEKVKAFAMKYAPETGKLYQAISDDRAEAIRNLSEVKIEMKEMDVVRFELGMIALCEKINYETRTLRELSKELQGLHAEHASMEKDSEAVAKEDRALAVKWKDFVLLLPEYVKARTSTGVVDAKGILSKWYKEDKLRLWQWNAVFGTAKKGGCDGAAVDPFEILCLARWKHNDSSGAVCGLDVPAIDELIGPELKNVLSYGKLCESQGYKFAPQVKLRIELPNNMREHHDVKVMPRTEIFYATEKVAGARFNEVLENSDWSASNVVEMEDGKVLYADYTVAALAISFFKYRVTNKKNVVADDIEYHGYHKLGEVAPTPLTNLKVG